MFQPSCGIRSGDPISPYLFLLVVDVLSRMIDLAVQRNLLRGFQISSPRLSHLLFADDNILFGEVTIQEAYQLRNILNDYGGASGQRINMLKSDVTFSRNTGPQSQQDISRILEIKNSGSLSRYLGLPIEWSKSRSKLSNS